MATPPLIDYITRISPDYEPPDHLSDLLESFKQSLALLRGETTDPVRVLFSYPIRHRKTETLLHGVLWLLEHDPTYRFVILTYSHARAQWLGKRLRELAKRTSVGPTKGWDTIDYWQNDRGGGVAVMSADQSKEGHDVHGLFCDDPIDEHSADVAERRDQIDRNIAYYTARCIRKGRPGPVLMVMSRLHPEDPYGRRLKRKWKAYHAPAIVDLGLPTEHALAPTVLPLSEIKRIREEEAERDPTERVFWSRFQGEPRVPGGDVFHEPARYSDETMPKWPGFTDIVGLDMAYSTTKLADFAAVVAIRSFRVDGKTKGFIRHADRFKLDPEVIEARVIETQKNFGGRAYSYVSGPEVGIIRGLARRGIKVIGMPARYNKLVRAQKTRVLWNDGDLQVPEFAPWAPGLISCAQAFRGLESDDDDLIDALVSGVDGGMLRGAVAPRSFGTPRV